MRDVNRHLEEYVRLLGLMRVTNGAGEEIPYAQGVCRAMDLVNACSTGRRKVMFVGNGGSAAIASHFALDYWHTAGIRSMTFLDGPLLTCLSNDHGYEQAFALAVDRFADPGDVLVAISSSGASKNILKAVEAAHGRRCGILTFSGFSPTNPLRALGDINFYVPSKRYGPVESAHEYILHAVLDVMMERREGLNKKAPMRAMEGHL
jgi:D-sedoheptulose 7-phosphate isomerase